jgi:hypothetical protein
MKKLLISAAFVAAMATPALAQSYNPEYGDANVRSAPYAEQTGSDAYAAHYGFTPREDRSWANSGYARTFGFSGPAYNSQVPPNGDENY